MRILIVDDEKNIRNSLKGLFEDEGHCVETADSGEIALEMLVDEQYSVVFLDVLLPGINGVETLKKIKTKNPGMYVIMMSGHASFEMAVQATRIGAYNFFEKPLVPEKIILEVKNIEKRTKLEAENRELRKIAGYDEMLGNSSEMQRLKKLIDKIAPTESRLFITGENGTGKELVARAVHFKSQRKSQPFVKINCAALPKDLIESELFGYEKGAFTGAVQRKKGKIEDADGGTLFLDEIGDMSLDTQAKLLRVLEENELTRLGGNKPISFDTRIISATNKNIPEMISGGEFREDLYHRLLVMPLEVPALRNRLEDIPVLIKTFADQFSVRNNKSVITFNEEAIQILKNLNWNGNIRELKNFVERIAIMSDDTLIDKETINLFVPQSSFGDTTNLNFDPEGRSLKEMIDKYEKSLIVREYERSGGNVTKLAAKLKTDRANLHRKLKQIGLK